MTNNARPMIRGTRLRREASRAEATLEAVHAAQQAQLAHLVSLQADLAQRGITPLPPAPDGYRWKTPEEMNLEFNDVKTLAPRRQELLAIRLGYRPIEAVPIPGWVAPVPGLP